MASVTERINQIKQPRGGYIKPSEFECIACNDFCVLNDNENVYPIIIGLAVDYLTRYMIGASVQDAFSVSLQGAKCAAMSYHMFFRDDERRAMSYFQDSESIARDLLEGIIELDDKSIINACKLVTFDSWYRNPMVAINSKSYKEINPDISTIVNVRVMVNRSIEFFKQYGPVVRDGFNFAPNGYTDIVTTGDGDFLTRDTLWDFKVSKYKPTSKHTLQLLMYWIMGKHSGNSMFESISNIGIFNPRLNSVYLLDVERRVDVGVIRAVERDVIGY